MRLTLYTDFSLRVLLYLANKPEQLVTITELADFYKVSRNHLVKVVHQLGIKGYILTIRGKNGGMKLARAPNEIVVGEVVRNMEPDFDLFECFNKEENRCVITEICQLKSMFFGARNDFLDALDQYTLADAFRPSTQVSMAFKAIPVVSN
ncbi:MAG: Rrf2 family transcriptional regulator [Gallionella sp.]|nr:Rrf2 family transcriptional regulator [Gallionella sp.]